MTHHLSRTSRGAIVAFIIGSLLLPAVVAQQPPRQVGLNTPAAANQRRVAVVIGNGAYTNIKKLKNPVNDATDVAAALQDLGFELAGGGPGLNLTQVQMKARIREFGNKLRGGGVGVFYYAGHGIQFNGKNFLLPVDIAIENEADVEDAAVDLQLALNNLAYADNGLNIMILDACRNNPFEGRVRDARDGLAEVRAATGTLIAYATAPGSVASDGSGRNGAYTEALLKQIKQPGIEVLDMFRQVREEVYQTSNRKQVPWTNDSLIGKFYFKPAAAPPLVAATKPTPSPELAPVIARDAKDAEREAWGLIYNSADTQDFRDFQATYKKGTYYDQAGIRLEQLVWEQTKGSNDKAKLQGYLTEFPAGPNAGTAKLLLNRLDRAASPVPVAPPAGNTNGAGRQQSNQYGIEFVAIPAGTFTMGSPAGETGRGDDEIQHRVTIRTPFGLGKYEVTQGQWKAVMGSLPTKCDNDGSVETAGVGEKNPVVCVSWDEVQQFIAKLNGLKDGYMYRLPSEAEWEYAARAGKTTRYYWGEDEAAMCRNANIADQTSREKNPNWKTIECRDGYAGTAPVGSFPANGWGLHDMMGNVWEWCADWYDKEYYNNGVATDPAGPGTGALRVNRGGSWFDIAAEARSASRDGNMPGEHNSGLGFRLARTP